jgi:hypothetical protein
MPGSSRLFRQEALEHHAGGHRWGERLHPGSIWARRAPLGLVALAVPLVAAGLLVQVDDSATGAFVVGSDGARLAAVLPASAGSRLAQGARLDLDLGGGRRLQVRVTAGELGPIGEDDATRRFGRRAIAGLLATSSPLILVQRHLVPAVAATDRGPGRASVRLDSRAVIPTLLSGLFGRGTSR